ncbi:MAG: SDR family NAD(P)-dependent oxidoreductase [Calditrichaeota bacterium]|nr:SDR family NAD(P)-dependent oxidoreductase [Candidatus Cloacimonadota bacterium]MCB1046970.1 SDR family NAD(P)-dependent oxidoreductase [Calditrichota bacterium]MCB9474400.1 SDR family NAD(P)-dependent oxidoreductase [Candidatus Delongbacteria bacterium]
MSLNSQNALITGASSGIGMEIARQLAPRVARLVLSGRRREPLEALVGELESRHACRVLPMVVDLRDRDATLAALAGLPVEFRPLTVLVNNAGLALGFDALQDTNPEESDTVFDTNVRAVLTMCRALVPGMLEAGQGHVLNLGSIAGRQAYKGGSIYCATKAAVLSLTRTLQIELADTPVRVSTIDPGMVQTDFSLVRFRGDDQRAAAVYQNVQPLTPRDVAEAAVWALDRPAHVQIAEMVMYPTCQGSAHTIHRGDWRS